MADNLRSGFYYLQSRYYNPTTGRFINADAFPATGQSMIGNNMFVYCGNNPTNRIDNGGTYWDTVIDVVSLCFSVADVIMHPDDPIAWLGVAADVASLVVPFVAGGGAIVKTATKAATKVDDLVDAAKALDAVEETTELVQAANKVDFYITPAGEAIPATKQAFNNNLSMLNNQNGKFIGQDSNGPIRIRVEQHLETPGYNGPYNPYHTEPHFHIDRRQNGTSGPYRKTYTGLMEMLR